MKQQGGKNDASNIHLTTVPKEQDVQNTGIKQVKRDKGWESYQNSERWESSGSKVTMDT